jgi:hypothetical protein
VPEVVDARAPQLDHLHFFSSEFQVMPRTLTDEERNRLELLLRDDPQFYARLILEPDDLGAVVRGHAYIEAYLEKLLERNMTNSSVARWHAIDITRRLEIARSLGEIDTNTATVIQGASRNSKRNCT